jgi:ATP-dependent exoDNAse (exonuclease V) alpha subunit
MMAWSLDARVIAALLSAAQDHVAPLRLAARPVADGFAADLVAADGRVAVAGDRVLVTRNDHRLGLLNGTRATVTAVDPKHRTLTLAANDDQQVTVPADWAARHLDHGYAMTCHKAQGATVHTALLYGAGALTREAGRRRAAAGVRCR